MVALEITTLRKVQRDEIGFEVIDRSAVAQAVRRAGVVGVKNCETCS